jgi:SAM-dependent methyltransferase
MLGRVADSVALVAARLPSPRRGTRGGSALRINLGSGLTVAPGWVHLDGSIHALLSRAPVPVLRRLYRSAATVQWLQEEEYVRRLREHAFVHHDLARPLPFPDGVAEHVFTSHLVEHMYHDEAQRLLAEVRRVLMPGGVVRVCVPDLEHAVGLYRSGARREALSYFFTLERAPALRTHRYLYDATLLQETLEHAGFTDVRRCTYREGRTPDLELLDTLPEETLYMEAVRPGTG